MYIPEFGARCTGKQNKTKSFSTRYKGQTEGDIFRYSCSGSGEDPLLDVVVIYLQVLLNKSRSRDLCECI